MPTRGNPYAIVRLEPEIMKILQEKAGPRKRGYGGGVSQYLRQLVYSHLGLGDPPCFGEPVTSPRGPKNRKVQPAKDHAAPELC